MTSAAAISRCASRTARCIAGSDALQNKALKKLTPTITKAVEAASDHTLAHIVGAEGLRHALAIAPRDIAPQSPAELEANRKAASVRPCSVRI